MDDKKLMKLAIIAIVLAVIAVIVSIPGNRGSEKVAPNTPLIQGLDINKVAAIEAEGIGKKTRLERTNNGFVISSRDYYPAVLSEVNNLIVNCLDIKVSDFVTADPDNYADLQVMENNADRVVRFYDTDNNLITGIVTGKKDQATGKTFVRKLSSNENEPSKVYLADRVSWIYTNPPSYAERRLLECTQQDLNYVKTTTPEGSYTIVGTKQNDSVVAQLQNIPDGKQARQPIVDDIFEAATDIQFEDMQRGDSIKEALNYNHSFVIMSNDQTEFTLRIAKGSADKYYVTCSSKYTNKEFLDKVKSGNLSVGSDKEAMAEADIQLQTNQSVKDFNARHQGWVYTLDSSDAIKLMKNFSELIEPIPAPAETESNATESK